MESLTEAGVPVTPGYVLTRGGVKPLVVVVQLVVSLSHVPKLPHVSGRFGEAIRKRQVRGKVEPRLRRVMESQLCSRLA